MRYLLLVSLFAFGCGAKEYKSAGEVAKAMAGAKAMAVDSSASMGKQDASEKPPPSASDLQRKIIYTADVDLVVEDFTPIPPKVTALAAKFGGYVAGSNLIGRPGRPRSGEWTIRVPVERYDEFLEAAQDKDELGGEVRRVSTSSKDVTEEYYDIETRLKVKKQAKQDLEKLKEESLEKLKESGGKLDEILKVYQQIYRVQEQIEQMQGRKQMIEKLTAMTTVNLSIEEIKDYVPEEALTYSTRLRQSFHNSITRLGSTAQNVSIAVIAASPWFGVLLVPVVVLWLAVKALRKRKR